MTQRRPCPGARGHVCVLVAALSLLGAAGAAAQGSTATVEIRVDSTTAPPAPTSALLPIRLESLSDPAHAWSAQVESGQSVRFRLVPPGRYRIVSGAVERPIEVASGDEVTISVSRDQGPASGGGDTTLRVSSKDRSGYGTRFSSADLQLLPDSNGVYGLIERSDPLVVTDLMEGGGTYLNPQRLGASGASWTQTSFRLGDADLTDPDRTGFAMLFPNLNALEAVSVATAGVHPDAYGTGTMVMLTPRMPASTWQRTFEFIGVAHRISVRQPVAWRPGAGAASPFRQRFLRPLRPCDRSTRTAHDRQPGRIHPRRAQFIPRAAEQRGHAVGTFRLPSERSRQRAGFRRGRPARTADDDAGQAGQSLRRASRSVRGGDSDVESLAAGPARVVGRAHAGARGVHARHGGRIGGRVDGAAPGRARLRDGGSGGEPPAAHGAQLARRNRAGPLARTPAPSRIRRNRLVHRRATGGTGLVAARRARRRRAGAGVAVHLRRGHVALERDRSGAVGDRRDRHHVADRRRSRAARIHCRRLTRGCEHPLEHAVAQHPWNVSRHQQRLADVPRRLRGVRRTAAAQLPGVRRSACADRLGPSLERRQRRSHSPGR